MSSRYVLELSGSASLGRAYFESCLSEGPDRGNWWRERMVKSVKRDAESESAVVDFKDCGLGQVFLKQYTKRSPRRRLLSLLGINRGFRTWVQYKKLAGSGLSVPEPLVYARQSSVEWLLSEYKSDGCDLRFYANTEPLNTVFIEQELGQRAAEIIASVHLAGFVHGDCKWGNFLWVAEEQKLYAVDFDGVKPFDPALAHKDVARFVVNAEEAGLSRELVTQFLHRYAAAMVLDLSDLERQVEPFAEHIREKHRKKFVNRAAL